MNEAAQKQPRMQSRRLTVEFLTPAFLGNAEQSGQWRTPPFKHLLREWWRVAWVASGRDPANVDAMRREEARLFGAASDGQGNRSLIRMRLDCWDSGGMKQWVATGKVRHPEVGRGGASVGADLYLGYGPLVYDKASKGTKLKANAAIQAGERARFDIAFPETEAGLLDRALALMSAYGTLGGRSRNGWGSLALIGDGGEPLAPEAPPLRDWRDCLQLEWAHAIGQDDSGALIWRTDGFDDWPALMKALAQIKIDLRTHFQFPQEKPPHRQVEDRHWLAYPVTNHGTKRWNRNARLPNSLRFKARKDEGGKLHGVIFHMPCRPPREFRPETSTLTSVWQQVHQFLDNQRTQLQRSPA